MTNLIKKWGFTAQLHMLPDIEYESSLAVWIRIRICNRPDPILQYWLLLSVQFRIVFELKSFKAKKRIINLFLKLRIKSQIPRILIPQSPASSFFYHQKCHHTQYYIVMMLGSGLSRSLAMSEGSAPVMEANVLQMLASVNQTLAFKIVLQNSRPSRAESKGIVVEAIQLLLPDRVFTLQDEQNITDQESWLAHLLFYRVGWVVPKTLASWFGMVPVNLSQGNKVVKLQNVEKMLKSEYKGFKWLRHPTFLIVYKNNNAWKNSPGILCPLRSGWSTTFPTRWVNFFANPSYRSISRWTNLS